MITSKTSHVNRTAKTENLLIAAIAAYQLIPERSTAAIRFIGNRRDSPAYLAVLRKSDCQSDLLLAVHHGKSQRAGDYYSSPTSEV